MATSYNTHKIISSEHYILKMYSLATCMSYTQLLTFFFFSQFSTIITSMMQTRFFLRLCMYVLSPKDAHKCISHVAIVHHPSNQTVTLEN